ncbi:MAG: cyclic nucleotide-binding domain-containing protein [Oscillochloridaceae bacterium umkhey_bin13]
MSASSAVVDHLRKVELFNGLSDEELLQVAATCRARRYAVGAVIFKEGDDGDELMIILHGCVRVSINTRQPGGTVSASTINMLYVGQSFGEMVLLGGATRSATVSCVEACTLLAMAERDFAGVCERNPRIGYRVMRNMASDLAYKLRSSNLLLRGNIRWQQGELGR